MYITDLLKFWRRAFREHLVLLWVHLLQPVILVLPILSLSWLRGMVDKHGMNRQL